MSCGGVDPWEAGAIVAGYLLLSSLGALALGRCLRAMDRRERRGRR